MKTSTLTKIKEDLRGSLIDWKLASYMIPIAFLTFFFHEFGHWTFGELWGNDMSLSLNNANTIGADFNSESARLWSAIGGPLFTIIQATVFTLLLYKYQSAVLYTLVFFAFYIRFFSVFFGGFTYQDEYRIASMLNINEYIITAILLITLLALLWKASRLLKLDLKAVGYHFALNTLGMLMVIVVNELLMLF